MLLLINIVTNFYPRPKGSFSLSQKKVPFQNTNIKLSFFGFHLICVSHSLSNIWSLPNLKLLSIAFVCFYCVPPHWTLHLLWKIAPFLQFLTLVTQILIPVDCLLALDHQNHLMGRPIFTNLPEGNQMAGSLSISWVCTLFFLAYLSLILMY